MTFYYELLSDNTIGKSTNSAKIAERFNLNEQTQKEIAYGYDGKKYLKGQEPTPPFPSYVEKRMTEYPLTPEQLDMIYWDKIKNTNQWTDMITHIKMKYPKG